MLLHFTLNEFVRIYLFKIDFIHRFILSTFNTLRPNDKLLSNQLIIYCRLQSNYIVEPHVSAK